MAVAAKELASVAVVLRGSRFSLFEGDADGGTSVAVTFLYLTQALKALAVKDGPLTEVLES